MLWLKNINNNTSVAYNDDIFCSRICQLMQSSGWLHEIFIPGMRLKGQFLSLFLAEGKEK